MSLSKAAVDAISYVRLFVVGCDNEAHEWKGPVQIAVATEGCVYAAKRASRCGSSGGHVALVQRRRPSSGTRTITNYLGVDLSQALPDLPARELRGSSSPALVRRSRLLLVPSNRLSFLKTRPPRFRPKPATRYLERAFRGYRPRQMRVPVFPRESLDDHDPLRLHPAWDNQEVGLPHPSREFDSRMCACERDPCPNTDTCGLTFKCLTPAPAPTTSNDTHTHIDARPAQE